MTPRLSRRAVLAGAAALGGAALAPQRLRAQSPRPVPAGFRLGTSSSAYQIEGAWNVDGRGPSIWDTWSHAGRVVNRETGDVACDHYNRYAQDVALMADAGHDTYRFSIAWPRVLPEGTGAVNQKGLDFYDRLVDALLARNVEPWPCLYHWCLPQALQDKGGWRNREIQHWFAAYGETVMKRLGDRVKTWMMLNEPSVVAIFGHGRGDHAPGLRGLETCVAAIHHQNLAQGQALRAMAALRRPGVRLGTVLSVQPTRAGAERPEDGPAVALWDALWNTALLDPLYHGRYPSAFEPHVAPLVKPGDLEIARHPIDVLGVNYYSRNKVVAVPQAPLTVDFGGAPTAPLTDLGWPIEPDGLTEALVMLKERYGDPTLIVTENGAAYADVPGPGGVVQDEKRIAYLRAHLAAALDARDKGAKVEGFLVWSLMDNFEWSMGYGPRFGMVAVEAGSLRRIPKASHHWFADVARRRVLA